MRRATLLPLLLLCSGLLAPACRREESGPLPPAGALDDLSRGTLGGTLYDPAQLTARVVAVSFWSPG